MPSFCRTVASRYRAMLVIAEHYPANSASSAERRYGALAQIGQIVPVDWAGGVGCGSAIANSSRVYDEWDNILTGEANDATVMSASGCEQTADRVIRHDIADHTLAVSALIHDYGLRTPDVAHLRDLVQSWAAQSRLRIPALTNMAAVTAISDSADRRLLNSADKVC